MIRTLYLRIAIVIFAVVWLSLALSGLMFSRYYQKQFSGRVEELQLNSAHLVVRLIQEMEPQQIGQAVSIASILGRGQQLLLVSEAGERFLSRPDAYCSAIGQDAIRDVLAGNVRTGSGHSEDPSCMRDIVGIPFTYKDTRYALFVLPGPPPKRDLFGGSDIRNLVTVLLISTFIVLLAAVYLVRPLKQITEATRRIAGGDFNVKLNIRQKDELGVLAASINHMADELQKIERMRQEFVSNVSHDIQTPLTSIRGFSKLLQQDTLDPEERLTYLKLIESESERLSRLSENLLKLASLDSEHHPLHPRPIALDEQLRRTVVACEPLWSAKQLELALDLPPVRIVADEDSLNQVWTNLLHNAIKFTPHGGKIAVKLRETDKKAIVSISDTGIGISPEEQQNVFRRFYKADTSRRSSEWSGNGLGLAIVQRIVDLHRGRVDLESKVGKGTTVRVQLPKTAEKTK